MKYRWMDTSFVQSGLLAPLKTLIDDDVIMAYLPSTSTAIHRKDFDGFFTVVGKINGHEVGVIYNDFKTYGGSYGFESSYRVKCFLEEMQKRHTPVIYAMNTIGVRISDGRRVFPYAFGMVTSFKNFAKNNLFITAIVGKCLGLGAPIFSIGDYRFSVRNQAQINLTGPEVFKLFFGPKVDFSVTCSSERFFERNHLIHELCENKEEMFGKIRGIMGHYFSRGRGKVDSAVAFDVERFFKYPVLQEILRGSVELFPQVGNSVKILLVSRPMGLIGVALNPPGKPNMISARDILKFREALTVFRKMQIPLVNLVDTPGVDPRIEENDKNITAALYDITVDIIDYPYKKMAIIIGRCFGGASVLSLPPFYGGEKICILHGAKIGIMDNKIIDQLLSGAPRLHEEWKENSALEREDLGDIFEQGLMDRFLNWEDVPGVLDYLLIKFQVNPYAAEATMDGLKLFGSMDDDGQEDEAIEDVMLNNILALPQRSIGSELS